MSDKTFPETSKKSQFVCIKSSLQFMHNKCIFKKFQDICCGTSHNGRQAPKVCAAKSEKHFQSSRKNSIHHFRINHNAPCLSPTHPPPPQILQNHCLGFLLRRLLHPEEIGNNGYAKFFLGGSGGGGVNKVLYGLCESSELYAKINQEHIILQSFNSIGTGVTYVYQYATERFQSRDQLLCQISCKKRKSFS